MMKLVRGVKNGWGVLSECRKRDIIMLQQNRTLHARQGKEGGRECDFNFEMYLFKKYSYQVFHIEFNEYFSCTWLIVNYINFLFLSQYLQRWNHRCNSNHALWQPNKLWEGKVCDYTSPESSKVTNSLVWLYQRFFRLTRSDSNTT